MKISNFRLRESEMVISMNKPAKSSSFNKGKSQSNKKRDDKPKYGGDKSRSREDKPKYGDDKSRSRDDKPKYVGDKSKYRDGKPKYGDDKSRSRDDKPKYGGDKSKFRGNFDKDRQRNSDNKFNNIYINKDEPKTFKAYCSEMTSDGKGIIKVDGELFTINGLLKGEEAVFELDSRGRKKYLKCLKILKSSQYRIEPACNIATQCGGCHFQHVSYEGQLALKQESIEQLMSDFTKPLPIIGMKDPLHYRNKVHATFASAGRGKVISGIYEEDSHRVVETEHCLIQNGHANAIIKTIRDLMSSFKIQPYNEDTEQGFLRHVLIRTGHASGEVMVVLVVSGPIFKSKNHFVKALVDAHPEVKTILMNINNRRTNLVLGDKETVIHGKGFIEDTLCEKVFRISSKSFYQVNPVQTEVLYKKAIELAGLSGKEIVLDAYCGIGTISLIASEKAEHVIGVELNSDAVKDAIYNAKRNHVENVRFYQGDAGEFMNEVAKSNDRVDVVFMDPPRSGSDDAFINALSTLSPNKIVYISCNPVTLARD